MQLYCPKCKNTKKFIEILVGGDRLDEYEQDSSGHIVFIGTNERDVKDRKLVCGVCNHDMSFLYKKFLDLLLGPQK